ncbi:MAG: DUF3015 domain-containing protein [Nitrospira sp.]|jgi:hypothetical protein|nr:DUF3015 domain-containing protein [Nitrospira sp.]
MKVLRSVLVMVLIGLSQVGIAAAAGNPDTGPGCGLGKLAWSDFKRQKDIAPQILMATTNGTFWSQTFGISFGTSGCTNDGKVWAEHKTEFFVAATFDNLAGDMARGQGEHLSALAVLLGVPGDHQAEFFAFVQERYRELESQGGNSSGALIKALDEAMSRHPVFAKMSQAD